MKHIERWIAGAMLVAAACTPSAHTEDPQPVGALPCDVERVLVTVCQRCHSDPPKNQAPFSLVTWADTQQRIDGQPLYTYMRTALASGRMPLAPVQLEPADRALLLSWLQEGAPAAPIDRVCGPKDAGASDAADDAHEWDPDCVMDASTDATDAPPPFEAAAPDAGDAAADACDDAGDDAADASPD